MHLYERFTKIANVSIKKKIEIESIQVYFQSFLVEFNNFFDFIDLLYGVAIYF